jgi:hypothetical protein
LRKELSHGHVGSELVLELLTQVHAFKNHVSFIFDNTVTAHIADALHTGNLCKVHNINANLPRPACPDRQCCDSYCMLVGVLENNSIWTPVAAYTSCNPMQCAPCMYVCCTLNSLAFLGPQGRQAAGTDSACDWMMERATAKRADCHMKVQT